jgi:hypothetical protein
MVFVRVADRGNAGRDHQHFHCCASQWCRTKSAVSLRRLMLEGGGAVAVSGDDDVTTIVPCDRWRTVIANWSGTWGAKLSRWSPQGSARQVTLKKTDVACNPPATRERFPVKASAKTLGVSRFNLRCAADGERETRVGAIIKRKTRRCGRSLCSWQHVQLTNIAGSLLF